MVTSEERKVKFFALMARYNELGCRLPDPDNFDTGNLAEVTMVLAELNKTKAEMDAVLDQEAAARRKAAAT